MAVPAQTLLPPTDADLQIPVASLRAFAVALGGEYDALDDSDQAELRAAFTAGALHVVAAELRRRADGVEAGADDYIRAGASDLIREAAKEDKKIALKLRARADQLDGGVA